MGSNQINDFDGCPYKDERPINTINKIRSILAQYGIFTTEMGWINNRNQFFSCVVKMSTVSFSTNGKGLTEEYCLASAYGELMERLQNQVFFANIDFSPKDKTEYGFEVDPFERKTGLLEPLPESFKKSRALDTGDSIYDFWNAIRMGSSDQSAVANGQSLNTLTIPFYSVTEKKVVYLPYLLFIYFFKSNGMSAGNTKEESLVQGFSEVLERFAMRELYFKDITPPTIPIEYIKQYFPDEYTMINILEENSDFRIVVKDCSLGIGLPVIGIFMMNSKLNKYCLKFGADPNPQIALQRCLSEYLQGTRLIEDSMKLSELSISDFDPFGRLDNFTTLYTMGKGVFPLHTFLATPTYQFNGINIRNFSSFKEKLEFLYGIIKKAGFPDIYIRDCSFLGFPSHQVLIPGMSEILMLIKKDIPYQVDNDRIVYFIKNLPLLSNSELEQLALSMENFKNGDPREYGIFLHEYFKIPVANNKEWSHATLEFILTMVHYKIGNFRKATEDIGIYIEFLKNLYSHMDLSYYYCVREFLNLKSQGFTNDDAGKILEQFFDARIIKKVLYDFSKENIFEYLALPVCWNCEQCRLSENCQYKNVREIYLSMKRAMKENPIQQDSLKSVFSFA
jgi:ribosomal protein S12 methylthiotransferase accessory factor